MPLQARRLPKEQLTKVVRSVFEANEYPSTMQRLYAWSPDECIPEFYSEARIFRSTHADMSDLAVPSWAEGPEDFIRQHRWTALCCAKNRGIVNGSRSCER